MSDNHTPEKARAVLAAMAAGMTARAAAEAHAVAERWADKLVTKPPRAVREASWYRALVAPIRERRAKRRGLRAVGHREARRV